MQKPKQQKEQQSRAARFAYEEIRQGAVYSFGRTITSQDVQDFARLSGDFNPLHLDSGFGKGSAFKGNIVHGMLAASLFSTLVGMHCPGERALYMSQTLHFRLPIIAGDTVIVQGTVLEKHDSIKMITLKTEILKEGKVAIAGEAKVKVLE